MPATWAPSKTWKSAATRAAASQAPRWLDHACKGEQRSWSKQEEHPEARHHTHGEQVGGSGSPADTGGTTRPDLLPHLDRAGDAGAERHHEGGGGKIDGDLMGAQLQRPEPPHHHRARGKERHLGTNLDRARHSDPRDASEEGPSGRRDTPRSRPIRG